MKISKLYQLIVENTGEINRLTAKFGPSSEALNTFYFKKLRTKYSGGGFIKDTNEILRRFNTLQEWEAFLKPWLDREDYYNAKNRARNFMELYNALSDKDMYSYDFVINKDAQPENVKKILETEMSYDIIHNDDTWLVVTPYQPDLNVVNPTAINASKFFSKMKNISDGATWCVGWSGTRNYFGHYTKDYGPHYIIIKKGQTKYNIQLGGEATACNKQDTGNKNLGDGAYNIFPAVIFNKIFEYAISKGFDKVKNKALIPNFMSVLRQRNYNQIAQLTVPKDAGDKFLQAIINNNIEVFKTLAKTNSINKTFEDETISDKFQVGTNVFTPLTVAYLYGRTEILQYLLTQPTINVNSIRTEMRNDYIHTPLFFILYAYGYGKTIADVSKDTNTTNLLLILNSDKANLNNEIYNGNNNVLGYIISEWRLFANNNTERTENFLYIINILKDKINLNTLVINRNLPVLRYLFSRSQGGESKELLPIFLNHPSIDINQKDSELYTVFSYLVSEGKRDNLKYILQNSTKKIDITGYKWLLRLINNDPGITALIEEYKAKP